MCSVFIMGSFIDRGEESLNTYTFIKRGHIPFFSLHKHLNGTPWTKSGFHRGDNKERKCRGTSIVSVLVHKHSSTSSMWSGLSFTHKQIFGSLKTVDLENSFQGEDFQETLLFWCVQETIFLACSFCLTSSFVYNLIFKNNSDKWPT